MNVTHLRRAALVLTAAALLGCGESPLGPVPPPPQASLIGSLLQATGLLTCTPMPTTTATQTVGSAGGVIKIGPHALAIPAVETGQRKALAVLEDRIFVEQFACFLCRELEDFNIRQCIWIAGTLQI